MRTQAFFKAAALVGVLALTGCASKTTTPEQFSGFLKDYSGLQEATTASGKTELRWISPDYKGTNYDNVVYNPVTYYPVPKPTTQVGEKALSDILTYTNTELKQSISERKPLATKAGPRSLIFRGAITAVDSSKEGLQFYEVVPIAAVVGATQAATGHSTQDTELFIEADFVDAATGAPVVKVVRKVFGESLRNSSQPVTANDFRAAITGLTNDLHALIK